MTFEWWHWLVLGIALVIAELAVPAFFLIWFGLGGVLVGLTLLVLPLEGTAQVGLWIVTSLAMVFLWFKVFKRGEFKTLVGQSDAHVLGEIGLLSQAVAPFERGRVRFQKPVLGADEWVCRADETIASGERVKVVAVEGSFLKVAKV